jgi:rubrerythrin
MQKCAFSELEGLRIAAEMEKRGGDFYTLAARVSRCPETKELLRTLAADEAIHLREFQKLYERESVRRDRQLHTGEAGALLTALAADIAFPKGVVSLAGKLENQRAILEYSIESEQDSIRFYSALAQDEACAESARIFEDIIRQERGHLLRLQKMLSAIGSNEE